MANMKNKRSLLAANATITNVAQRKELDGVAHMVIPVVALKEGILNNIFYPAEEIQAFVQAWNGVPVPINHPVTNGVQVSANTPTFEETVNIGKFFNAVFDDGKLKGELWLNIDKAERLGFTEIIEHFDDGLMMEVSTGLFTEIQSQDGLFGADSYKSIATNIRPDHIALLPNDKGACSIEDGCGAMRFNKDDDKGCCDSCEKQSKIKLLRNKLSEAIKGLGLNFGFVSNEISHESIRNQINGSLDAERSGNDPWAWVVEVFEDVFIYEIEDKLYRRSYTEQDGVVTLSDDKVEVVRLTQYEPVTGIVQGNSGNAKYKEKDMEKKELVAQLIANSATQFTSQDEETLMGFDEGTLEKMVPVINEVDDKGDKIVITNEDMAFFNRLKANEEQRVSELRKAIVDGYEHLTDEVVANMNLETLDALAKGIKKPIADFSGQAGSGNNPVSNKYRPPSVLLGGEIKPTEGV